MFLNFNSLQLDHLPKEYTTLEPFGQHPSQFSL